MLYNIYRCHNITLIMGSFGYGAYVPTGAFREKSEEPVRNSSFEAGNIASFRSPDTQYGYNKNQPQPFYDASIGNYDGYYSQKPPSRAFQNQAKLLGSGQNINQRLDNLGGVDSVHLEGFSNENNGKRSKEFNYLLILIMVFFVIMVAFQYMMISNLKEYMQLVIEKSHKT